MFNVAIIGGENTPDYQFFQDKCIYYLKSKVKEGEYIRILTIGDKYVDIFANKYGIETKQYNVAWTKKKDLTPLNNRNKELINDADAIIYFDTNRKSLEHIYKLASDKPSILRRRVPINSTL